MGPLVGVAQLSVGEEVQDATPTGVVQPHVVATQLFPIVADTAVQPVGAAVGPVVTLGQVVTV